MAHPRRCGLGKGGLRLANLTGARPEAELLRLRREAGASRRGKTSSDCSKPRAAQSSVPTSNPTGMPCSRLNSMPIGWIGWSSASCPDCGHDFLIAFRCKERGRCPSCNARRIAQTAAHPVDHVFPPLPVHQWVMSVPKRLRWYPEREPQAISTVLHVLQRVIETTCAPGQRRQLTCPLRGGEFDAAIASARYILGAQPTNPPAISHAHRVPIRIARPRLQDG